MQSESDRKAMVALLNSGDKRELRAFMRLYSKSIYDRALAITRDAALAKDATRRVLAEVVSLAAAAGLKENIDAQLMALTDQICSELVFFDGLVEDVLRAPVQAQAPLAEEQPEQPEPMQAAPEPVQPEPEPPVFAAPPVEEAPARVQRPVGMGFAADEEEAPEQESAFVAGEPDYVVVPNLFGEDDEPYVVPAEAEGVSAGGFDAAGAAASAALSSGDEPEEAGGRASPFLVIAIILLSILVVLLVWVLVVKLMTNGILPNYDFGFARWFNTHVFQLY